MKSQRVFQAKVFQAAVAMLALTFLLGLAALAQQHQHETQQRKPETQQDAPAIKMDTGLVSLSVTVTDDKGKAITGLKREDFKVYENGIEQQIDFFGTEEPPVSWGLVLDRSGSMQGMIEGVYRAAVHVVDEGTEEDEAFIVTFNKKVQLISDFTSDKRQLQRSVSGLFADGGTALWDAVSFALDHLKQARHRKKVLVVITDGEDNSSRISSKKLMKQAEEADVLIYTVGMFESRGRFDRDSSAVTQGRGWEMSTFDSHGQFGRWASFYPREELTKLAEITGAKAHFPTNVRECREVMQEIAAEVNHQYSLGYYPSNSVSDGKWRKLKVVVGEGESKGQYVARTRTGYYAPKGEKVKQASPDGGR